ncbi:hypothetical protein [Corynebacterium sp. HMSC071B10]|uniref:hypothetical protein n=1 Tax=Corynebacterium sp. HMSC071B10 TaxID=1739494 RepID=UPI0008A4F797|nr:hypothetical protein [Corynebacterium sp. HMSC071B10]OFP36241.1 hypothetical protein HMPREF2990_06095 [Corynebacterium sp. HMSC071B10]
MRAKILPTAALVLLLSATPAAATVVNVELDPGNPNGDAPQINVEDVPIVLIDASGNRTTLRTVGGAVDFQDVVDGHYTLTFPENPEYRSVDFSVPVRDPQTGKALAGVKVYPKHKNLPGGSGGEQKPTPTIPSWAEPSYPQQPSSSRPATPPASSTTSLAQTPPGTHGGTRWSDRLASTGTNVWWLLAAAGLAILVGLGLVSRGTRDTMQTGDQR